MNKQLSLFDYNKKRQLSGNERVPSASVDRSVDSLLAANMLSPDTSVSAALEVWLQSRRRAGLSENTLKNYRIDITCFIVNTKILFCHKFVNRPSRGWIVRIRFVNGISTYSSKNIC